MIRQCIVSTTRVQITKRADGSWSLEGIEAQQFLDSVYILERWAKPFNTTFHVTVNPNECFRRLESNESDHTNLLIPIQTISPHYYAPQSMFFGQNQFISGFKTSETTEPGEDSATVISNFHLLEFEVYLWSLIFQLILLVYVTARVLVLLKKQIKSMRGFIFLARVIFHHIGRVFNHSNDRFRLITLLYAVFCFYIVTMFLCVYKTSHVIAERPFHPTTYEQSLNYESSVVGFYDQFVVVSKDFESAVSGSIKRQLWDKMIASGFSDKYKFDLDKIDLQYLPDLLNHSLRGILMNKGIAIASSITIALPKSLFCGYSPEGQLYFLKTFADPSESEMIYGYATAKQFSGAHIVAKNLQRAFEGHIIKRHYDISLDVAYVSHRFAGTSASHQWRQYLACNHENALIPDVEVQPVSLSYFHSFLFGCSFIWIIAFIINLNQIVHLNISARCCSRRRRMRRLLAEAVMIKNLHTFQMNVS